MEEDKIKRDFTKKIAATVAIKRSDEAEAAAKVKAAKEAKTASDAKAAADAVAAKAVWPSWP